MISLDSIKVVCHYNNLINHLILINLLKEDIWVIVRVRVMVFNETFNNISVISWRSVLLMGVSENTTDLSQV